MTVLAGQDRAAAAAALARDADPRFRAEQVRLIFHNSGPALAATVLIALVAYGFLASASVPYAGEWLAASLAVSCWRALTLADFRRAGAGVRDASRWMGRLVAGSLAAGAVLGALGQLYFLTDRTDVRIFIAMVMVGSAAGALGVFSVAFRVYAAYLLVMLAPFIVALALVPGEANRALAAAAALYAAISLAFSHNTGARLREAIQARFESELALARLREEAAKRERVAAQLAERESHIRMLGDNVPALIAHFDRGESLTYCNLAYARHFGTTPEALLGRHAREILGEALWAEQAPMSRRALQGESQRYQRVIERPEGTHTLQVHRAPCATGSGVDGYYVFAVDITGIEAARRALANAERELRLLVDSTPAMICYVDRDSRYRMVNRAYAEFHGMTPEQMIGRDFRGLLEPEMVRRVEEYLARALGGEAVRYERIGRAARGPRDLVVQYAPDFAADGTVAGTFALLTDVTELKDVDRMKSEFVATVSHELRTPLTSIQGSIGLLAGGAVEALPAPAVELLQIAERNCTRLTRLVNDILDIEKIESGRTDFVFVMADLGQLVEEAMTQNAGLAAERRVRLEVAGSARPAPVRVDVQRLGQVLANLLSNAVKYSPEGGRVAVSTVRHAEGFRVEVSDDGPGVPTEFRARIFQRFSQGDSSDTRRAGGTGLGLAISKSIVEHMGGRIGFRSEPGCGAAFHFDLPAAHAGHVD